MPNSVATRSKRGAHGIGHNGGPPLDDLRCITVEQFAKLVGFSVMTARRLLQAGEGPPVVQLSARRVGIRVRDLAAWQEARVRS
jgi:predicted DNA-binding transcriptional regulator AlpA